MGNSHRCATQVKIEIETWNLRDIFFLFISNHVSLYPRKNSKIFKIRTTLLYKYKSFNFCDAIRKANFRKITNIYSRIRNTPIKFYLKIILINSLYCLVLVNRKPLISIILHRLILFAMLCLFRLVFILKVPKPRDIMGSFIIIRNNTAHLFN